MKKILLVSGCSYTTNNYTSSIHPEMNCCWTKWPELLAEKLNMQCINLGASGSGQEYIYSSILDKLSVLNLNDVGLVIAGWSRSCRRDYSNSDRWNNKIWDERGDNKYFVDRMLRYQYSFQQVCKSLKLSYKQAQIIDSYDYACWSDTKEIWPEAIDKVLSKKDHYKSIHKSTYYNLIDKNFIGFPGKELGGFCMQDFMKHPDDYISEKDRHPNAQGHKVIAEKFYENI
jgi:hypothetical protein